MKKTFALAFFISALCVFPTFAKIETLPTEERPSQWIQFDYSRTLPRGIERDKNWVSAEYNFDWQPFGGFAGIQLEDNCCNLALRTSYLPFAGYHENGVWRFGLASAWRARRYFGSYQEHDIFEEIEVRWISARGLTFTARTGYSLRLAMFDALKNVCVTNSDFAVYAEVDKVWKNGLELFTALGSYNLYRCPLFFCPQWTFGAAWNFQKTLRLGAQLELGMTDFFAAAAYFNHIELKFNLRVCF